ncbi:heat shock 70 kDa protein 12B isoform X1 [Danio rerio]|uniref:Gypsy retrotransposon integrase-like protein 1 n=1 Tax=Danio rerio TaxID=7955 RepID=A0AB32TX09_DANRE
MQVLEFVHRQGAEGNLGWVNLNCRVPESIPAGKTVVLEGSVRMSTPVTDRWVVVEAPRASSLPGGIMVSSCLLSLPAGGKYLPIVLKNETEHDVVLPPKIRLAEVNSIQCVMPNGQNNVLTSSVNLTKNSEDSKIHFNFDNSPLTSEWRERVTRKLNSMHEVFACHDLDFGHTTKTKHHIRLHDETPFKHKARPIHPKDILAVRKHLQELLDAGIIRESESPFSSPIVVVRKKNGEVRLCVDYRKLNLQTIKDAYALPNLEETFSALTGSKWFSVLDLKSGYYQIEVEEIDKPKTAFVCPLGFWEFNRMPQGVTNAPSTFQRLMERCMGDINLKEVLVFIDDLIVFSATLEEHEERLLRVLHRLKDYGLKLSPEKCTFFQTSVRYLGHIVSSSGVETDPEKIKALKTWPSPTNLKELRSFLGFAGYYRRFIKDFSKIVKPLNHLTSGYPPLHKSKKTQGIKSHYLNPREPFKQRWTSNCQHAFEEIIDKLTSAPILGFANPKLPYILHTDASTTGLGAALYQEQEGKMRAIAFASRGLSFSESRYPAHKLEFLALKWAVTEKFHDYLYGSQFTVITDSNPLTYILTTAKLDAASYRWLSALSTYSFSLKYRAGKLNLDADGLSRRPHEVAMDVVSRKEQERIDKFLTLHLENLGETSLTQDEVEAICDKHIISSMPEDVVESASDRTVLVHSLAMSSNAVPNSYEEEELGVSLIPRLSVQDLIEKQGADSTISQIISHLNSGEKPSPTVRGELPELSLMMREWNRFVLLDGVLYRKRQNGEVLTHQLVLPKEFRATVLRSLHDEMGHMGIDRTLDLARSRFYWPKMAQEVEQKIKTCPRCVLHKAPPEKAAPLVNIRTTRPLELLCMDFLSLEPDRRNFKDILVITDHFTKYAVAVPTVNQKARTVAQALWDNFIVHYGFPERLHSDQGRDFESHTIKELCSISGIKKGRTTPYHPRGNPVERFNRTLLNMLGSMNDEQKAHWRDFVKPLVHAYNCTKSEVTGFTPYELMFGRQPRLPIDLAFGLPTTSKRLSHSQYVSKLKKHLEESYQIATRNALKNAERNKIRFDKHVVDSTLEVGDRVLVKQVRLRGKHKLADKWEPSAYIVVRRVHDLPVYTVRPEGDEGPLRTLHRDLLLPCGFLTLPGEKVSNPPSSTSKPRTRQQVSGEDASENGVNDTAESMEDEVPEYWIRVPVTNESHENALGTLTSTFDPPVGCDPQLPFVALGDESHVEMDSAGLEACLDDSHQEKQIEQITTLQGESSEMSESGKSSEGELSEEMPQCPDDGIERSVEEELEEEIRKPLLNAPDNISSNIEQHETSQEPENPMRRSQRRKEKPDRLQYSELGNPLVIVAQSLFHGLTTAFTNSLNGVDFVETSSPSTSDKAVTCQPVRVNATGRA